MEGGIGVLIVLALSERSKPSTSSFLNREKDLMEDDEDEYEEKERTSGETSANL